MCNTHILHYSIPDLNYNTSEQTRPERCLCVRILFYLKLVIIVYIVFTNFCRLFFFVQNVSHSLQHNIQWSCYFLPFGFSLNSTHMHKYRYIEYSTYTKQNEERSTDRSRAQLLGNWFILQTIVFLFLFFCCCFTVHLLLFFDCLLFPPFYVYIA